MFKLLRRVFILHRQLHTCSTLCTGSTPTLSINPASCLMDEKVIISVTGLAPEQTVTLTSYLEEGGARFEARGVYKASKDGKIFSSGDPSLAGTFTNVEPMGLFWSIKPTPGQKQGIRLVKKDVTTPLDFKINVYDGAHTDDTQIQQSPLTSAMIHRRYMRPTVRRIPVTEGPYRGTIFVPEGDGPFAGLIDTFGGLVSLIETRAALLASHGYAAFSLSYLSSGSHLPKHLMSADPVYLKEAADWFSRQDYVDANRLGAVGLCYGGCLSLMMAALLPKMRVVVNINGIPVMPSNFADISAWGGCSKTDEVGMPWPNPEHVYNTDEGIVINEVFDTEKLICIPAWQHGAKILVIVGEDDKQVHPKYHKYFIDNWPEEYRANIEMVKYPGAGHLIEPPYSPCCRVTNPGRARMSTIEFVKEEFRDELMMCGGFPKEHAVAQEDAWQRMLQFLHKHLREDQGVHSGS